MNRNSLLIGLVVLAVIIGGVYLGQRIRNRNLTDGGMTQASPNPTSGTVDSPIPGKPQVKVTTSKGELVVELDPNTDTEAVASFLGKWSRGECNNQTITQCGFAIKTDGTVTTSSGTAIGKVISGSNLLPNLSGDDTISATLVLSK